MPTQFELTHRTDLKHSAQQLRILCRYFEILCAIMCSFEAPDMFISFRLLPYQLGSHWMGIHEILMLGTDMEKGYAVAYLVEVMRYKPGGRGFDCY